ncbi:MAG: ATP-binding protein [Kofleriaceae bacterium]
MGDGTAPLVVYLDDEAPNRIVFEAAFGDQFLIKTVESGADALALLDEPTPVAVLLTDMRMPGMSGEEVLRVYKERSPQTVRMIVTAYPDIDPILRAINEGLVARYMMKPWTAPEMVQVLRWATEAWTFSRDSGALSLRLLESERLITLGSIAATMTHDLRQPLTALDLNTRQLEEVGNAGPALRKIVAGEQVTPEELVKVKNAVRDLDELAADIRASVVQMTELSEQLARFLRPTPSEDCDPLPVVRHAISVCRGLAMKSRSQVVYEGSERLPGVHIATAALTQVLINVITNALQAVGDRQKPGGKVVLSTATRERMLIVEVKDDGVGMSPEVLERVGTPFFTTRLEGTGLGVSQCQRLVGAAGGRFQIASSATGTTVTIALPLSR